LDKESQLVRNGMGLESKISKRCLKKEIILELWNLFIIVAL